MWSIKGLPPLTWLRVWEEDEGLSKISDMDQFWPLMDEHFLSQALTNQAKFMVTTLQQGTKPIVEHSMDFKIHAQASNFDQEALVYFYIKSLQDRIRYAYVGIEPQPTTLEGAMRLAIRLGDTIKANLHTNTSRPTHPKTSKTGTSDNTLVCTFCKKPGHDVKVCPDPRSYASQAAAGNVSQASKAGKGHSKASNS